MIDRIRFVIHETFIVLVFARVCESIYFLNKIIKGVLVVYFIDKEKEGKRNIKRKKKEKRNTKRKTIVSLNK